MLGKILKSLKNADLEPISGMDATFLYGETPTSPMHVGSLAVIQGSLSFSDFRKIILSRIHMIPKLRQRLLYVPLSIDYPYWVDDPNFDIDLHLQHIALPKPGNWRELRKTASRIFSEPLDNSRPLWSFTFVEGLDNIPQVPAGSVAIIAKIHHVVIDGEAGKSIMSLLYDFTPQKSEIPPPRPYEPKPLPNDINLILNSSLGFLEKPLKFPKLLTETFVATMKAGALTRANRMELPTAPFSAPSTPLNGIISPRRKWNTAILSLERIKVLKNIAGTTINDVMLAICAGALRRYLLEKDQLPHKPLVAMVPISTRTRSEKKELGNKVSSMLVQLATDIEDPVERLQQIHENTIRGKNYQQALGAKALTNMAEIVPFGIANQAARLYSRYKIAAMHNPVFNLTITNVPGPQFPLYLNGHKMLSFMGMAPIMDGMGLLITIFSYDGQVTISPTSDVKSMPDLDEFSRYLRESANELEAMILQREQNKKKKPAKKKMKPQSDVFFMQIKKYLKEKGKKIKPGTGLFQVEVTGPAPVNWRIDLNKSPGVVRRGNCAKPDAVLTIQDKHLLRIAEGRLDIQTAQIQGRLKVKGDLSKALKLGELISNLKS